MAGSWKVPLCPTCAATFRRMPDGQGIYDPCGSPNCKDRLIREAAKSAALGRRDRRVAKQAAKEASEASRKDWEQTRLRERRYGLAEDMGNEGPFPNPRRNTDENRRELERRVAAGDASAALYLVSSLVRDGSISAEDLAQFVDRQYWNQVVGRAHDAARKIEALLPRNEHQSYTNYETFNVAVTLENDRRFYEGWAEPAAIRLWNASSESERSEDDTTYSTVSVRFGDMIKKAVAGWKSEDPTRLGRENLENLSTDLEQLAQPLPKDSRLLGDLFTHLLQVSLDRVQWREIAEEWLHSFVPESENYGTSPRASQVSDQCRYCGAVVVDMRARAGSRTAAWATPDGSFGCLDSPESTSESLGTHEVE